MATKPHAMLAPQSNKHPAQAGPIPLAPRTHRGGASVDESTARCARSTPSCSSLRRS